MALFPHAARVSNAVAADVEIPDNRASVSLALPRQ
jgi:hypothetical protein